MTTRVDRIFFAAGATFGLISVVCGAFGAHAIEGRLTPRALEIFQTAARYQMFHAMALLATGWAFTRWPGTAVKFAGGSFMVGQILFCGSLYALSFGAPKAFGAVAPLGGLSFMLGWGGLAVAAIFARS
ncbi:MAG: DUF423 domain-containing protein [Polyangiales bacterium]